VRPTIDRTLVERKCRMALESNTAAMIVSTTQAGRSEISIAVSQPWPDTIGSFIVAWLKLIADRWSAAFDVLLP